MTACLDVQVLFQFVYTSCFGAYAGFLLIQSRSILAPIAAHVACNFLGVPDFPRMLRHPQSALLLLSTLVGIALFYVSLSLMASKS